MNTKAITTMMLTLALGAFSLKAQHDQHAKSPAAKAGMSHDHMMMMANEPHHRLAMAYHANLATFAKALKEQTASASSPVNVEFARAAVSEMRRSFDQVKQHHQAHMTTMSAGMRTQMGAMMQKMETHQAEMNTQLTALELEVRTAAPDAGKVSALAASIHTHLEAMSKMHEGGMGMKMKP